MAVSVRLDPLLEANLSKQSALLGMTKSAFIKDALERVLGMKDPAQLLREVRMSSAQQADPSSGSMPSVAKGTRSENTSQAMKAKLRAQRSD